MDNWYYVCTHTTSVVRASIDDLTSFATETSLRMVASRSRNRHGMLLL